MRRPFRPVVLAELVALFALFVLSTELAPLATAANYPVVRAVSTGIRAEHMALAPQLGRIVVAGGTDASGTNAAGENGVAIVDTIHRRLIARILTPGSINALGLSERRALAYLIIDSIFQSSTLWVIDLRTGVVRQRIPLSFSVNGKAIGVDDETGRLFVLQSMGEDLMMLSDKGKVLRTLALPAFGAQLFLDSAQHRVVVAPVNGEKDSARGEAFFAFDTRSGASVWTKAFAYPFVSITSDAIGHQLWSLSYGGRVTVVDIRNGRTTDIHPSYRVPDETTQGPLVVDAVRSVAYVTWCTAQLCHLDAADAHTTVRRTLISLTRVEGSIFSYLADFVPLVIDTARRHVIGYSRTDRQIVARAEQTGRKVAALTGQLNVAADFSVAPDGAHVYIAVPIEIQQYSDTVGTTRTSAVALVAR